MRLKIVESKSGFRIWQREQLGSREHAYQPTQYSFHTKEEAKAFVKKQEGGKESNGKKSIG